MSRLTPIDPAQASGKAKVLLDGVGKAFGFTPNITRIMAQAPAVLEAYLAFAKAMSAAKLGTAFGDQIALAVAGANGCEYCASAHMARGKAAGIDTAELARNLDGRSADRKVAAGLAFAHTVLATRGHVADEDVHRVRDAGYSDGEIAELLGFVALNIFTNYFNTVTQPEVDFLPRVILQDRAAA